MPTHRPACPAFLALLAASGCIPVEADVAASSHPALTAHAAPLQPAESVVFLGRSAADDDDLPDCVRDALAELSPETKIVAPEAFRSRSGSRFARPDASLKDDEVAGLLADPAAQQAVAALAVRYLFLVDGKTSESGYSASGTMGVAASSSYQSTGIKATIWDARETRAVGQFSAFASGRPGMTMIMFITVWEYTPTESIACERMAGEIQRFLASGYAPDS